jgi:DNA gyrase/topoisomerase IV subunit B
MQDKFPIIVYGEDGTHITELLLDFLDKFGSQLIEDRVHIEPPEPLTLESITQSRKIVNQMDFCVSVRRVDNENRRNQIRFRNLHPRKH